MTVFYELILKVNGLTNDIATLKPYLTDMVCLEREASSSFVQRNVGSRVIGCPWGNLHGYIFSNLTDEQKCGIYESAYEAGYPSDKLPSKSEAELFQYLESRYGGSVEDLSKDIRTDVKKITSLPFKFWVKRDRVVAYRVLTLLYRLHRFRPKLRTLLMSDSDNSCSFEFRAEWPLLEDKAMENSSILSELLCRLSFMMPRQEQSQVLNVRDTLSGAQDYVADDFLKLYRDGISKFGLSEQKSLELVKVKITKWHEALPNCSDSNELRLDVLLSHYINVRAFSQRIKSNKIITDIVLAYPLNLNPYATKSWVNKSESACLTYLTDSPKPLRIKPTLNEQAELVESIVAGPLKQLERTKALNLIIKATILHDEKLGVKVPSRITGLINVESSPIALLKKAVRQKAEHGIVLNPNASPEGLSNYWFSRIALAIDQQNYGKERGNLQFTHKAIIEHEVCKLLIEYVNKGGPSASRHLYKLYVES